MDDDLDRAEELIALLSCVLPHGFDELAVEHVAEVLEPLVVRRREKDLEMVRGDQAFHADRAAKVHLPRQTTAELYRLELTAKRLGKRTLDESFQAALELLESHLGHEDTGPTSSPQGA
ncbi:MAG: hypothetical protein ABSE47_15715 [Acidimicrobiales bacterium]